MNLLFENLGKIKRANLELGNFTLIVGDNSLGKTILLESYALYSKVMLDQMKDFAKWKYIYDLQINFDTSAEENFNDFENKLVVEEAEFSIDFKIKDNKSLEHKINEFKGVYLNLLRENILNDMFSNVNVEINYNKIDNTAFPRNVEISNRKSVIFVKFKIGKRKHAFRYLKKGGLNAEKELNEIKIRLENRLNTIFFREIFGIENIMFFPSERNLYKTNAYKKSAEFIEESFSLEKEADMRYSESLFVRSYFEYLDYLEFDEENYDEDKKELYELLCKSLGGTPIYEDGNVVSIEQGGDNISPKLFSTKQSRLLPYFMLCTFLTDHADRIIIEEPEAHMSLKSMFELVDITSLLLEENKIIMTSHSDVFVSLLNNLIKRNNINAKVYELIDDNNGSILKEVIPGDYGYELSFMSDQITRLNNETFEAFEDVVDYDD